MPPTKTVNSFKNGLNLSVDNINQPKDTYSYALNVVKEDPVNNPEIISNEQGFSSYLTLEYDYILLGSIYLGLKNYILFIKNKLGDSAFNQIILLEDTTSTVIYNTVDLNFNDKFLIKGTYRVNYKNERVIYWVDGLNEDRVLNIDNGLATGDVDELSIDVKYSPAILTDKVVNDDGGSLLTGTYEFFGSYKTKDNATTPWFILTANPIYVIDDNTQSISTTGYISIDGCDSKLSTNKAIQLDISNLDDRFNTLRIGVIKTYNNSSSAIYIDNIFYSTDTLTYNYTGNGEEVIIADTNELLIDRVKYYASNAITQMDSRLLRANTKSNKIDIDYQSYANNIVVDYYIEEELVDSMEDSSDYSIRSEWWKSANTKYSDKKSLMRDEVYSLGIAFGLIKEGVESEVYHIPGRALNILPSTTYRNQYNDTATIPYSTAWDSYLITENGTTQQAWQVINTAASSVDTTVNKLAYWESQEIYPDGLDLPLTGSTTNGTNNTKIRHHKMPNSGLEPIFRADDIGSTINFYKRHLGLNFTNIVIPDELVDNVSYIRIYMTPRISEANKSIIAKGIFTNCSLTKINVGNFDTVSDNLYIQPCQPYNDQVEITNGDCYKYGQDDGWDTTHNYYHSFYSPDTTLRTPSINTNKVLIENEMTGIVHYYNTIASAINAHPYTAGGGGPRQDSSADGGYKRDLFYDDSNNGGTLPTGQTSTHQSYNEIGVYRSTYKSICILKNINQVESAKSRRKLKQAVYVPFNSKLSTDQIGGMDNPYISAYGSSNVLLELNPNYNYLGATATTDTSVEFTDNNPAYNITDPDQPDDISGTFHFHPVTDPIAVYRYGSIKKDNPSQYGTIANGIEYNPTDLAIANPTFDGSNTLTMECKGLIGDSWIDMFSVKRCRYTQKEYYTFGGKPEISIGMSTFFTESNINHRLRYAEGTDFRQYYPKQILTTSIKEYLDVGFNFYIFSADNYYKENSDFDKEVSKKNYGISLLDLDVTGVTNYSTRILYSEKLLDESRVDNYRVNLVNNYKDLQKNTGFISLLFKRGQELFAITRDSLWRVYGSNETIKSDTSNITIGTGDFFSLEPTEVMSIEGGFGGSSSKFSLTETPYGYFYIDKNKGKLILFNDKQADLTLLGVYNFVKDNFEVTNPEIVDFDLPLLNSGYLSGYDSDLKRILITKLDYKLTTNQLENYKGIFNPDTSYTAGDIYLKDGVYYTYNSTSSAYTTIVDSSDLSDFIAGSTDAMDFTYTSASHGTLTKIDGNTLTYTPTTNYTGSDTFHIIINCTDTTVNATVAEPPVGTVTQTFSLINTSTSTDMYVNLLIDGNYVATHLFVAQGSTPSGYSVTYTGTSTSDVRVEITTGYTPSSSALAYALGMVSGYNTIGVSTVNVDFVPVDLTVSRTLTITINN